MVRVSDGKLSWKPCKQTLVSMKALKAQIYDCIGEQVVCCCSCFRRRFSSVQPGIDVSDGFQDRSYVRKDLVRAV